MLFRLYYPMLKWQIVGYLILSIAVAGIITLGQFLGHLTFPITIGAFMLGVAYYVAPVVLTRRDYRQISTILPVTTGEKMAFLMLYFGAGTYLMLNGPLYLLHFVLPDYVPCYTEIYSDKVGLSIGALGYLSGYISAFSMVIVALWALVVSKTSRAAMVIAAVVVVTVAQSMIGGIIGLVFAITHIDMFANMDNVPKQEDIMMIGDLVNYVVAITALMSVTIIIIFVTLLYRKLKYRGF